MEGSTKVGCAYKDCRKSNWGLYVVCEYDPYGNVIGQGSKMYSHNKAIPIVSLDYYYR